MPDRLVHMPSDDDQLATRLAISFDLGRSASITQVARGAVGAILRLDVWDSGQPQSFAVKRPFWERPDETAVALEVAFRNACSASGVPSPSPLRTNQGTYVFHDHESDASFRLYEWVSGGTAADDDPMASLRLAEWMGTIHHLGWQQAPEVVEDPWYLMVDADWPELAERVDRAGITWASKLLALVPQLLDLSALVNAAPTGESIWCHRDLKNGNVMADGSSGSAILVDWDNSGPLAPEREFGMLIIGWLNDLDAVRALTTAYRRAGGTAQFDGIEGFSTAVGTWLNFLAVQTEVLLDPAAKDHHTFAEQQVSELIGQLPTIKDLEAAASAIKQG